MNVLAELSDIPLHAKLKFEVNHKNRKTQKTKNIYCNNKISVV